MSITKVSCSYCKSVIDESDYDRFCESVVIGDSVYCDKECAHGAGFLQCDCCGEYYSKLNVREFEGMDVCPICIKDRLPVVNTIDKLEKWFDDNGIQAFISPFVQDFERGIFYKITITSENGTELPAVFEYDIYENVLRAIYDLIQALHGFNVNDRFASLYDAKVLNAQGLMESLQEDKEEFTALADKLGEVWQTLKDK